MIVNFENNKGVKPVINTKFKSISISICLVTLLTACSKDAEESVQKSVVRPAKLIVVENAIGKQSTRYPAVIRASKSMTLTFQVGGLIQELAVNETQEVKQDDFIAKLEQRDYKNQLDSAKAQYENAEAEYQRALKLAKKDVIAKSNLEKLKSQRDVAKSQMDSADKALSDTILQAPFDGVITNIPVKRLENIQPGESIATLLTIGTLEATINLPASVIATARTREDLGTYIILDAAPEELIPATYKEALLEADTVSQTYAVTFTFKPPEKLIVLPGMNATILLTSTSNKDNQSNNVSVPLAAVMSEGNQQYLWVVNSDDMTVTKRDITIKEGIGETLVVTQGLIPGEIIVGAGAAYLSEGMKVRPWSK